MLPVARAGFDGDDLVLLDDANHELQRLRRLAQVEATGSISWLRRSWRYAEPPSGPGN